MASYPIFYGPYGPPTNSTYRNAAGTRAPLLSGWSATQKPRAPISSGGAKPAGVSAEEWVRQQVEMWIKAQLEAVDRQEKMYLDNLNRQSMLEAERGQALGQALQAMDMPGRIQGIYGNASADIGGLAQAFSGELKNQATADAAAQTRMLAGTGQEGAVRNQGENMANVSYGLGGYIPARSMSETGAAFAAQAALEPSFAARIGQEKAADVHAQGLEGLSEFANARAEVESGRFDMTQELKKFRSDELSSQAKLKMDANDAIYDRMKDERDYYLKQQALAMQMGDDKRADKYFNLAKEREGRMIQHESRMAAQAQGVDVNGNPLPGYKKDASGKVVKVAKPKAPADKTKSVKKARAEREDEFRKSRLDAIDKAEDLVIRGKVINGQKVFEDTYPSYQVAFSKLWSRYKDLLRFAGPGSQQKTRTRITQMINEALAEAGFTIPGKLKGRTGPAPGRIGNEDR
jgi:hypothetical protein